MNMSRGTAVHYVIACNVHLGGYSKSILHSMHNVAKQAVLENVPRVLHDSASLLGTTNKSKNILQLFRDVGMAGLQKVRRQR